MSDIYQKVNKNLEFMQNAETMLLENNSRLEKLEKSQNLTESSKGSLLNIIYELDKLKENTLNVKNTVLYLHNDLMGFMDQMNDFKDEAKELSPNVDILVRENEFFY